MARLTEIQAALVASLAMPRPIPTRLHSVLERLRRTSTLRVRVTLERGAGSGLFASVEEA